MQIPILPGITAARAVFGLSAAEIAQAVLTDEGALFEWLSGRIPPPIYLNRLERLDELAREVHRAIRPERIVEWLDRPVPALQGETPKEAILSGRSGAVLSYLTEPNAFLDV